MEDNRRRSENWGRNSPASFLPPAWASALFQRCPSSFSLFLHLCDPAKRTFSAYPSPQSAFLSNFNAFHLQCRVLLLFLPYFLLVLCVHISTLSWYFLLPRSHILRPLSEQRTSLLWEFFIFLFSFRPILRCFYCSPWLSGVTVASPSHLYPPLYSFWTHVAFRAVYLAEFLSWRSTDLSWLRTSLWHVLSAGAPNSGVKLAKYSGDPDQRLFLLPDGRVQTRGLAKAKNGSVVMIVRATQFVNEAFAQVSWNSG